MRFNSPRGEYPLPILRPAEYKSDYKDGNFSFDLDVNADSDPHSLIIRSEIDQDCIKNLLENGSASLSLAIHCESTYLYEMIDIGTAPQQSITFDQNKLFGDVYFTLVVKAVKDIGHFQPKNLIDSLEGLEFSIRKGDFLAVSQEFRKLYSLPPLKLGADIFDLIESPELDAYAFEVALSGPKIEVYVGSKLNQLVQFNMATQQGRDKNISTIYFPVLIDVLYRIKSESFGGIAWYEAISETMRRLGFDVEGQSWDPLVLAQTILRFPYSTVLQDK